MGHPVHGWSIVHISALKGIVVGAVPLSFPISPNTPSTTDTFVVSSQRSREGGKKSDPILQYLVRLMLTLQAGPKDGRTDADGAGFPDNWVRRGAKVSRFLASECPLISSDGDCLRFCKGS